MPQLPDKIAALLIAFIPLAMWAQSRSAVLFLSLAALAALWARIADGEAGRLFHRMRRAATSPVGLCLGLFLAWALISVGWSHRTLVGLRDWLEFLLPILAGMVLVVGWTDHAPRWALRAVGTATLIAALFTLGELVLGHGLRALTGTRLHSFIFNRTVICLFLLIIPVSVVFLVPASRWIEDGWKRRAMKQGMILAYLLFGLCLLKTESGAARLGFAVAMAAGLAAWLLPRLTLAAFAAGIVALVALGPVQGALGDRLIPPNVHEAMKESHSRDRIDIWLAFGELIRKRPLFGAGFGASEAASTHPLAKAIEGRQRVMLDVGHPHSLPVQAWAETGFIGALLLALAGLAALWRVRNWPGRLRALAVATAAGAVAIAAVGHGAWQGWWVASLAASCVLFTLAHRVMVPDLEGAASVVATQKDGSDAKA